MKTPINQIITVTSLFFLSISALLVISWGMTSVVFESTIREHNEARVLLRNEYSQNQKMNIKHTLRLLIPKIK